MYTGCVGFLTYWEYPDFMHKANRLFYYMDQVLNFLNNSATTSWFIHWLEDAAR